MDNATYTCADYALAMNWLEDLETNEKEWTDEEAAVRRVILALPEPAPRTYADLTNEERRDAIGMAVENSRYGWKGWVIAFDLDGFVHVLTGGEVLSTGWWDESNTILLPDEPRMIIPGCTPDNQPTA